MIDDEHYVHRYVLAHPRNHCCHGNASIRSPFVLDVDVAVGDIRLYIVAIKCNNGFRALLCSCKIYRIVFTTVSIYETLCVCVSLA
jgi:hypothetical protein